MSMSVVHMRHSVLTYLDGTRAFGENATASHVRRFGSSVDELLIFPPLPLLAVHVFARSGRCKYPCDSFFVSPAVDETPPRGVGACVIKKYVSYTTGFGVHDVLTHVCSLGSQVDAYSWQNRVPGI